VPPAEPGADRSTEPGRSADAGREAVYAAELAAFDGTDLEVVVGFDAIRGICEQVTSGPWWPGPAIELRRARVDSRSSSTRCLPTDEGAQTVIRVATSQTTRATIAHELAHALAGVEAGHGPRFRRALLDVVLLLTNTSSVDRRARLHHDQLAEAFVSFGLPVAERRWPTPPADLAGPIAL
jgi:hypothetical protein